MMSLILQRLVVGENSAIEYVGQNFGADSLYSRYNKYLVGVVDEKSKTIRLHDAQTFSLKQVCYWPYICH